uniref:Uncharacterized protein n=1 Tax=Cajanus cajan TaxID=3821 RepID=A0A151T5S6_CAJCA|nr:hypothetical protein KK1_016929 [Cajanus cajan]
MEPVPIVMYVSSDEEEEEVACLEEKGRRAIDLDWIKEFLDMSDEETNEVVVLDEVKKPELKSKSLDVKKVDDDDEEEEEDDCVVLDGDPENRVTSVEGLSTGSDELVVVGEKGQIACRDYPHPRHLCVKFPYSSAPHEKHCDQCHCYVCDSVAPCLKGTGHLGTDHCHATDKSETWRTLRKNFMLGKTAPLLASSTHVNVIPQNQASRTITMHERSSLYSSLRNHVSSPNAIPECSTATNFTIPSGTNNGRCRVSGSTLVRNRYQSHSVPQHGLGVRNHAIQRVRGHGVSSLGHQFLHSHMMLNRLGSVGVGSTLPMNHSAHGASGFDNHINPAQQYGRYHAATGFLNNRTCYGQNDVCVPQNLLYPDPCSQPNNLRSVSNYSTAYETQLCYLSNGSQNFYANCVQGNNVPSSNVASLSINRVLNEHQVGSQNENACGNVIHCGTTRQYSCQQKHYDTRSMNIYSAKESGAQFTGSTCLGSVDDIKQWLFDEENSVPVGADVALAFDSELNIPSPDLSTFDASTFLYDFENSWDCPAQSLV